MKKKIGWIIMGSLMVLSLLMASCSPADVGEEEKVVEEEEKVVKEEEKVVKEEEEEVKPYTGEGDWWDKYGEPQYGGTFTLRWSGAARSGDPYFGYNAPGAQGRMYLQVMAYLDWTIDRDAYTPGTFGTRGIPGMVLYDVLKGELAESWETPDDSTIIFHVRKGINYALDPDNEASRLVNGRELTASDIEYHWQRMLGLGSGYTEPSPYASVSYYLAAESITATDKYTCVWKLSYPTWDCLNTLLDARTVGQVVAREVVEKYGDAQDWENAVGTGPFMLTDYVTDTCFTYTKNPNYWGYDERYPENRIPYVDGVKGLIIPDESTALAALRTAKIDIIESIDWRQADSLEQTNPELKQAKLPQEADSLYLRVDNSPFTDIRVRKALQMAIDLDTMAKTFYGGYVEGTPCGLYHPTMPAQYSTPYDQWPEEVKAGYAYNPEGAKELLAEAGYPDGFKTNCVATSRANSDLLQILKSYFSAINVDMEINVMESTAFIAYVMSQKHDQISFWTGGAGLPFPPLVPLNFLSSTNRLNLSKGCVNDPVWDAMAMEAKATLDLTEQARLCKKASDYFIAQQWQINLLPKVIFNIYQPWFKGYSGEYVGEYGSGFYYARCWVDHDLKKTLGR